MIRRAVLATSLVAFAHTGAALLFAGPPQLKPVKAPPIADRRFLNPLGLALSSDGHRAYVALSGADVVAEVDLVTGRSLRRISTGQNPREVRRDGDTLTVNDDGPGALIISLRSGRSQRVEQAATTRASSDPAATVELPASSQTAGPDRVVLTAHHEPRWAPARAGSVTEDVFENSLSATLGAPARSFFTAPLDRGADGVTQPSAIVWDGPYNTVFMAAPGSDAVIGLDPDGMRTNLKAAVAKPTLRSKGAAQVGWSGGGSIGLVEARPPTGLIRFRLPTQSNPRRLALSDDGQVLVASNTLSDSLTVIAVGQFGAHVVRHIPLGGPEPDASRRGEVLFHSARLSFNGRFACSSCHPGGGSDDRVWITPTEDPDFARRTKPLFGVRDTAPYGWHGDSPTLADRVRKTLTKLHKHTPKRDEVRDLVAYLESLGPPAPAPVEAVWMDSVERGRELFEGPAKCSKCHAGERLTDAKRHDVGTGGLFDTPSLRGVGGRQGLLHSGQANGPRDIFLRFNLEHRHGEADELDLCDLEDLLAYLRSL
jgi:hypothetical protein